MILHSKFLEVKTLVNANIPVLLVGERGSGKTTLVKQIADELKLKFFNISMTRQTTLSHLLGFMSVNGTYIPSLLNEAFRDGGLFLLDEIDAADANVILSLNTIENGYLSFPTGIINVHPNFRLIATANPQDEHQVYTGRTKLDASTLDRFDIIEIERDNNLEQSLVDPEIFTHINLLRKILKDNNSNITVSMRDSLRYQKRKDLNLLNNFIYNLIDKSDFIFNKYISDLAALPKYVNQKDCNTFDDLVDLLSIRSNVTNGEKNVK